MRFIAERINRLLDEISKYICPENTELEGFKFIQSGYGCHELPDGNAGWQDFRKDDRWGGKDRHYWFKTTASVPEKFSGKIIIFEV